MELPLKLPPQVKKAKLRFPDLPWEVRNKIYQYYFQVTYRCELAGKGCDSSARAPKTFKLLSNSSQTRPKKPHTWTKGGYGEWPNPLTLRFPVSRAGRRTIYPGPVLYDGWLNPHGALILLCKQVCVETLPLLYNQITFVFEAPYRIGNIL